MKNEFTDLQVLTLFDKSMEELLDKLSIKVGDYAYAVEDDRLKRVQIVKIECSFTALPSVCVNDPIRTNSYINVHVQGSDCRTREYGLYGFFLAYDKTPQLAINKLQKKYQEKIEELEMQGKYLLEEKLLEK